MVGRQGNPHLVAAAIPDNVRRSITVRCQKIVLACSLLVLAGDVGAQNIVECPALPAVPGMCDVTAGDANLLIEGTILQQDRVLRRGQLLVGSDGLIACADCNCSAEPGFHTATRVTCPEGVVSPGFINLHEHSTYSTSPPDDHGTERFDHRHDWRIGLNGHNPISSASDTSPAALSWGELRHLLSGTTSMAGAGSVSGFVRNLDDEGEMEGLSEPELQLSTFPHSDADGTVLSSGCLYPGFDDPQEGRVYVPHVAQGIGSEARNELTCMLDASLPGGHDALHDAALIGSIALTANDAVRLGSRRASVIWSPRHDISLYGMTTPVTLLEQEGVNVALATNWQVTGSMSLFRELQCAIVANETYFGGRFDSHDLLGMVTWNAAKAAQLDHVLGHLSPGHWADLVIFDGSTLTDYDAAIQGHPADVTLVLRGGLPMYGDADVLELLGAGDGACETVGTGDCLSGKRVCVNRESGGTLSWSGLLSSFGVPYFCITPPSEPTCVPFRNEGDGIVFDGIATPGDADGDGVADGVDNCPAIFNPPRPVDAFVQADEDGDGIGDVCDDPSATLIFEATFEGGSSCTFSTTVTPELCDGIDNDCDGAVDEEFDLNACGGCLVLAANPGDPCNVCGQYVCSDPDTLVCDASCALTGFGPEPSFVREGEVGVTTIPEPLVVTLSGSATSDTFVTIASSAAALSVVGGGVIVATGNNSAPVLVNGVTPAAAVTLTASLDGASLDADVRVVGATELPAVVAVTPAFAVVPPLSTVGLAVSLDIPAGVGGSSVSLMLTPGGFGSVPASVLVASDELSAGFDFTSGASEGSELVTATLGTSAYATVNVVAGSLVINEVDYDQPSTDTLEFVEIYNGSGSAVDLTNLSLVLMNGSTNIEYNRIDLGSGSLGSGQYLVVGSAALLATVPGTAQTIAFSVPSNNIQNGAPDGLALIDESAGVVLDVLSYEGEIVAGEIVGVGLVNFVEGSATAAADLGEGSLIRYPNGVDTDDAASDWALTTTTTPGAANVP